MNIEDKKDFSLIIKRVLKVIFAIVLIKSIRAVMIKNEQINSNIREIFSVVPIQELFRSVAINMFVVGAIALLLAFLYKGKDILRSKMFNFLFFFCLLDSIFIYVFPEIPSSVLKAMFLN